MASRHHQIGRKIGDEVGSVSFVPRLSPLWTPVRIPTSEQSLACGLGFQSLPDCLGFPHFGFPPTSKTEHFFSFPIHPVIGANCATLGLLSSVNETEKPNSVSH